MSDWISVSDRLPEEQFYECLVFDENFHWQNVAYCGDGITLADYEGKDCFREQKDNKIIKPTHWMPLPNPP
jgi:hypothetical protein